MHHKHPNSVETAFVQDPSSANTSPISTYMSRDPDIMLPSFSGHAQQKQLLVARYVSSLNTTTAIVTENWTCPIHVQTRGPSVSSSLICNVSIAICADVSQVENSLSLG